MKICAFASGNGSNFQKLVENGIKIDLLISNKKDAYALKRAKNLGIKFLCVENKNLDDEVYELRLLKILKKENIDLIILSGYMKMVKETLLSEYEGRMINIHPSYLPNYKGVGAIKNAYNDKVKYSGVSIHLIDKNMDEGTLLLQEKVYLDSDDTLESFQEKIHAKEYEIFHIAIKKFIKENE